MSQLLRRLPRLRRQSASRSPRDWRPRIAEILRRLGDELAALPVERWTEHTLSPRAPQTVAHVVAELGDRVSSSRLRALLPSRGDSASHAELLERLRGAADRAQAGRGRHGVGELSAVVQRCYDITVPLELPDPVPADASLAVARARVASAPTELRTLLRGRSLVAEDAGWRIGSGPEISGTAAVLVSWLSGRAVLPAFPPRAQA